MPPLLALRLFAGLRLLAPGPWLLAPALIGRDDSLDLPGIERLDLIVMHGNRNQRAARPIENMVRSVDSHQPPPGPFQLLSDDREANWTRHKYILCYTECKGRICAQSGNPSSC